MKYAISIVAVLGFLAFAFQNCATSAPSAGSYTSVITGLSSAGSACEPSQMKCNLRVYRPGPSQEANGRHCVDSICVDVHTIYYDSRNAIANCTSCSEADSTPGGQYNREEGSCQLNSSFALRPTLDEAISSTLAVCRTNSAARTQ